MRPKGKSKMKPRGILQYKCWEINPAINQAPQIVAHSLIQILSCIVILLIIMYLDYAEEQAKRHQAMYMRDWRDKLDAFLQFNGREVLKDAGHISMKIAQKLALAEYDKFHTAQLHQEAVDAEAELENEVKQLGYKPDKSDKKQHAYRGG